MKNGEDIIIYDPFDFVQDMFINYCCLFLCDLCTSVVMSRFEKTNPISERENRHKLLNGKNL